MNLFLRPECYNSSCEELRVSFGVKRADLLRVMRSMSSCCCCLLSSSMACRFTSISVSPLDPQLQCSCFQLVPNQTQHQQKQSSDRDTRNVTFRTRSEWNSPSKGGKRIKLESRRNVPDNLNPSQNNSTFKAESSPAGTKKHGCAKVPYCNRRIRGIFIPVFSELNAKDSNSQQGEGSTGAPVACEMCRKSFRSVWGLKIHMKKFHLLQKCTFCQADFRLRSQLENHLMTKHRVIADCVSNFIN